MAKPAAAAATVPSPGPVTVCVSTLGGTSHAIEVELTAPARELVAIAAERACFPAASCALLLEGRCIDPEAPLCQQGVAAGSQLSLVDRGGIEVAGLGRVWDGDFEVSEGEDSPVDEREDEHLSDFLHYGRSMPPFEMPAEPSKPVLRRRYRAVHVPTGRGVLLSSDHGVNAVCRDFEPPLGLLHQACCANPKGEAPRVRVFIDAKAKAVCAGITPSACDLSLFHPDEGSAWSESETVVPLNFEAKIYDVRHRGCFTIATVCDAEAGAVTCRRCGVAMGTCRKPGHLTLLPGVSYRLKPSVDRQ